MTVKYVKEFQFPREFGFQSSAQGRHDPRAHRDTAPDEYADHLADGGQPMPGQPDPALPGGNQGPMIPLNTAVQAARGAAALGARRGVARMQAGRQPRRIAAPAPAPAPSPPGGALAKGGFLKSAVKRPGRLKNLAKKHGVSLGQEIAHDKHSSDPSLRSAANLGARFRSGEFRHKDKGKD